MITKCFRCNTKLEKSEIGDYTYYCPECDEDFYSFEIKKEEEEKGDLK